MADKNIRIAIAQINLCVGDIQGNKELIIENIHRAQQQYADIIIFPELAVTAYPLEDLLFKATLHQQIKQALQAICAVSNGLDVIIGYPLLLDNKLYNSCSLIRAGKITSTYHKQRLPNYGVFDEKRYFVPGEQTAIFDLHGVPVALTICEDIWHPKPCQQAQDAGAKLIININASPYELGKIEARGEILKLRAQQSAMDIIYVNLVGGQDELVFDGGSMAVNRSGEIVFQAPQFIDDIFFINYLETHQNKFFVTHDYDYQALSEEASIYHAIVTGVKDYAHKNGFTGAVIGLSGGIDSALTLCVAVEALGAENVEVVIMPSQYTASMSNEDAQWQAQKLGVQFSVIPIDSAFTTFNDMLKSRFANQSPGTSEENIQSRCRGILLMAISNKTGKLLLTTGNKSEMSVGYTTLYGDMAGGFAPLKDIPKTMVFRLANWLNKTQQLIPQRVIERPPSAELRADQKDEDSLPPYEILDDILEKYIELDQSLTEIIDSGADPETVEYVIALVDRSEHKRRQAPPGVKISKRALGRDRRYPLTSAYRETPHR